MTSKTLPSDGDEFEIRCEAPDAEITLRARSVRVHFTGNLTAQVTSRSAETDTVTLTLLSLRMAADLPDAGGAEDGGTVEVRLKDDAKASGHLRLTADASSELEMLLVAELDATVRQPDGSVELSTDQPMELWSHLAHFPPRGDQGQLKDPVNLVVPDNPDTTVLRIQDLPLKLDSPRS